MDIIAEEGHDFKKADGIDDDGVLSLLMEVERWDLKTSGLTDMGQCTGMGLNEGQCWYERCTRDMARTAWGKQDVMERDLGWLWLLWLLFLGSFGKTSKGCVLGKSGELSFDLVSLIKQTFKLRPAIQSNSPLNQSIVLGFLLVQYAEFELLQPVYVYLHASIYHAQQC